MNKSKTSKNAPGEKVRLRIGRLGEPDQGASTTTPVDQPPCISCSSQTRGAFHPGIKGQAPTGSQASHEHRLTIWNSAPFGIKKSSNSEHRKVLLSGREIAMTFISVEFSGKETMDTFITSAMLIDYVTGGEIPLCAWYFSSKLVASMLLSSCWGSRWSSAKYSIEN